jgi:TonB-linked SusC/RagA family outer membrane protein
MRTALGQFMVRGPREAAWFGAGICVLLAVPALGAQSLANDQGSVARDNPFTVPSTSRRTFVGVVTGRVIDVRTSAPVAGASVEVDGSRIATATGDDGRYRLTNVPAGQRVIIVRRLGYAASRQSVTVTDDQQTTADFSLQAAAIALDQVVVTGTAGGEQRRSIGNSVATIDASQELERSAAPNLGTLLQSRAAGVIVTPNTGRVGAGPTIQIRGRSSLSLSSEPIVYVDGVRVNNATGQGPSGANAASFGAQNSQVASRLNDINPDDIETIEIIKGPAAATIYGTEAANGVIQIITKRGRSGGNQWTAKTEQGAVWFRDAEGRIPVNYQRDPAGAIVAWNPIKQEEDRGTPIFRTGRTQSYTAALSGGREQSTYYASGTYNDDEGIEPNNSGTMFSGRGNLSVIASSKIDIQTSLGYFRATNHLGADNGLSAMLGAALGHPLQNPASRGFAFAPPEVPQQLYDNAQDINRFTGSATLNHRPIGWFAHRLLVGIDYTSDDSRALEKYAGPDLRPFFTAGLGGQATADGRIGQTLRNNSFITGDYSGTATFNLTPAISSASSIGGQFVRRQLKSSSLGGIQFPAPGVETVSGTTTKGTPSQSLTVNTTVGGYAQQRFGWNDRLFVTGAVRVDNNSAFGEDFKWVTYPKVSATWVMSEEPFWNWSGVVDAFKLRAAYGQSGQQPNAFVALRTVTNSPRANGTAGVTPGSLGNPDLKPERGTEVEAGFEAGLFNRLSLDFTFYTRRTKDAILSQQIAPSSGFAGTQTVNIGETSNRGFELQANLNALTLDNFAWDIGANVSTNKDRVEDRGGLSPGTGLTRDAEGYPIGGLWTKTIASATRNPDNTVTNILCNNGPPTNGPPVACAAALATFVGTPTPKVLGAVTNTFTIAKRLSIHTMVDFKRGHKLLNANDANRCALNLCEARFFPESYSTEYLAAIIPANVATVQQPFIQDASFVKLREVSATYQLPEAWVRRARVARTSFTLAGRNLATWSDYNGMDPEVRGPAGPVDQGLLPPLTQFLASLTIAF